MCKLNVIVVLEFISRDLYLLFAIRFSSKFQNSVFYQHMRPKSGLKFPRPLAPFSCFLAGLPGSGTIGFMDQRNHTNGDPRNKSGCIQVITRVTNGLM